MDAVYVQYGCGHASAPGWRNFDASPTLRLERLPIIGAAVAKNAQRFPADVEAGDIVRGLPIAPGSCQGIYASHVIEHLALSDARAALRHTRSLLAPGGRFRVVVPDLRCYARRYLEDDSADAAHRFMEQTCLGWSTRRRDAKGRLIQALGNAQHLWMWDHPSLERELQSAGFSTVRPCVYGDSEDPRFAQVEDPERFQDAVALEAQI